MMTAGSVINAEPRHSQLYQLSSIRPSNEHSPKSSKGLDCDMTYRYNSTERISPTIFPPFAEEENNSMEGIANHDQPSSAEEKKNAANTMITEKFLSPFHPASREAFSLNPYSINTLQMSTAQRRPGGLQSPPERNARLLEFNPSLKKNDFKRISSEDVGLSSSRLNHHNSPPSFDDDDDSWKVCGVCNDKATGYHFNALTCEGCKGFFRRSIKNGKNFTCSYSNQCSITKSNRRQCQACRLRKCIEIGMKRECIMSHDQIQQKKTLVLTNRLKRAALEWQPPEMKEEQRVLLDVITTAFKESNPKPGKQDLRGGEAVIQDSEIKPGSPCPSPASSDSSTSNFLELIKRISSDIVSRTPSNMSNPTNEDHVLHFTDIMEFSIKEIIKFCKKIPTFMELDLKDQIALLKAGCTEILFLKANYTYDIEKKALTLGPDILYTRQSFLQGGMSPEYTDAYLKFHEDLGILKLDDTEMASLSAIALFSADRSDVVDQKTIEDQQQVIACALQAYTGMAVNPRNRFANIMSFLSRLRTLNALCTHAFSQVQKRFGNEIKPLVIEVQPDEEVPS